MFNFTIAKDYAPDKIFINGTDYFNPVSSYWVSVCKLTYVLLDASASDAVFVGTWPAIGTDGTITVDPNILGSKQLKVKISTSEDNSVLT